MLRAALTYAPVASLQITPSLFYQHTYWNDVPTLDPGGPGYTDTLTTNWSALDPTYTNLGAGQLAFQGLRLQPSSDDSSSTCRRSRSRRSCLVSA